ncbi:hypothetical protein CEXT_75661 [Caerostris extrusa]|uniref:Uncharacterized protein n=1 Tax=Caerostris extrusa TaxID=172846 RepID=A0AAV4SYC7_CAEEX|nr:hypothetical protein CEXT_75661 [Caerostris extrusa]
MRSIEPIVSYIFNSNSTLPKIQLKLTKREDIILFTKNKIKGQRSNKGLKSVLLTLTPNNKVFKICDIYVNNAPIEVALEQHLVKILMYNIYVESWKI